MCTVAKYFLAAYEIYVPTLGATAGFHYVKERKPERPIITLKMKAALSRPWGTHSTQQKARRKGNKKEDGGYAASPASTHGYVVCVWMGKGCNYSLDPGES